MTDMEQPLGWAGVVALVVSLAHGVYQRWDNRKTREKQLDHERQVAADKLEYDADLVTVRAELKTAKEDNADCAEQHRETKAQLAKCQDGHEANDRRLTQLENIVLPGK